VGFVRAVVTAQREPIAVTVIRALTYGTERFKPLAKQKSAHTKLLRRLRQMGVAVTSADTPRPETREIRDVVAALGELAPVLLMIDEFGKNLEAFADTPSEADLFLLQELAEWTRGRDGIPLAVVTMQHMAFDEYASGTSAAQRREWAKTQGRFEDIPFVDSPAQTRALIGAAFEEPSSVLQKSLSKWSTLEVKSLGAAGLGSLAADQHMIEKCWPLHPVSLAILPDLCERYGQNERTLFSFLAGHEPLSVASYLKDTDWHGSDLLPSVRLDRVYDYFVDSAATMVAVSSAASRWVEIDTRIRDARGIDEASRRVLKAIGLLNLVSAGGTLRASRQVIRYAAADGYPGTEKATDVDQRVEELVQAGLVTFRDFADEFRVWQGSDFDLRSAVDISRRRLRDDSSARILQSVFPLTPLVAARHSHTKGTLRAFERKWIDESQERIEPLGSSSLADGQMLYLVGTAPPKSALERTLDEKPSVFVITSDSELLVDAARELAAIDEVLGSADEIAQDWVARRELIERRIEARALLEQQFENAYGSDGDGSLRFELRKPGANTPWEARKFASASAAASEVADLWFNKAIILKNDLVNRHDLSSQAARARRVLIEAMLAHSDLDGLEIEGFGPDRTMYLSVLKELGLHQKSPSGWAFEVPPKNSDCRDVWDELNRLLDGALDARTRVTEIYARLAAPPYGLRRGVTPVLFIAALLIRSSDIALYEHGTFRPVLSAEVCERFVKNPGNFEVKYFASRAGARAELLTEFVETMKISVRRGPRNGRVGSVLAVLSHLVATLNALPEYVRRTSKLSEDALVIRRALLTATEPDELLFTSIPEALGLSAVAARGASTPAEIKSIAQRVADAVSELRSAYPKLLNEVLAKVTVELRGPETALHESLAARAREISGRVLDPRVERLIVALTAEIPGDEEWAEYVAMNVTGTPPAAWSDVDRGRFFSLIHELGGTFRRIEALHTEIRSRGDGFDAVRVTITRADGVEAAKLVWVDQARRESMAPVLADAMTAARAQTSSEEEARDFLLALLAEGDAELLRHAVRNDLSQTKATLTPAQKIEETA